MQNNFFFLIENYLLMHDVSSFNSWERVYLFIYICLYTYVSYVHICVYCIKKNYKKKEKQNVTRYKLEFS